MGILQNFSEGIALSAAIDAAAPLRVPSIIQFEHQSVTEVLGLVRALACPRLHV